MVADRDVLHALADGLDDADGLVTADDWEDDLIVRAREGVEVGRADGRAEHADADLARLGRRNEDVLDDELVGGGRDDRLALDVRHCGEGWKWVVLGRNVGFGDARDWCSRALSLSNSSEMEKMRMNFDG